MATKLVPVATSKDVAVCLALDPPTAGTPVGGGIHVVIPPDFAARIALGQQVPGCTYAQLQPDGSLYVTDVVQTKIVDSNATKNLPAADVTALQTELATAVTVSAADVAIG